MGLDPGPRALRKESIGREKDLLRDATGFPQDEEVPADDRPVAPTGNRSQVPLGRVTARSMKTEVPHGFCAQRPCARAVAGDGPPQGPPIQIRFERLTFFKPPALPEVMTSTFTLRIRLMSEV